MRGNWPLADGVARRRFRWARVNSHRLAASTLSPPLVLKAIAAFGACRRTRFTACSKSGRRGSGLRIPPPMTTTFHWRRDNAEAIADPADSSSAISSMEAPMA
jgi:hypothetical protein